jgi:hypothetical protein
MFYKQCKNQEMGILSSKFLAHLSHVIAVMTWRPSSSSVGKARFVTAGAISMKLGVRIPWGNTPRAFLIFAIRPILCPPGGHLENQTFAI